MTRRIRLPDLGALSPGRAGDRLGNSGLDFLIVVRYNMPSARPTYHLRRHNRSAQAGRRDRTWLNQPYDQRFCRTALQPLGELTIDLTSGEEFHYCFRTIRPGFITGLALATGVAHPRSLTESAVFFRRPARSVMPTRGGRTFDRPGSGRRHYDGLLTHSASYTAGHL